MKNDITAKITLHKSYTDSLQNLIISLLKENNIKYHVVEARTKTQTSLEAKINNPNKSYKNPLEEIHDITGIRIVAYYIDDIDRIEELVRKEFEIFEDESYSKLSKMSANEFGYLSVHCIFTLNKTRENLTEWKPYKSLKAEVQIRTVLQHSWAVIAHALQYKNKIEVPFSLRRKLSRLAGLLELADEQFLSIKNEHKSLEEKARNELESNKMDIQITSITLKEFIETYINLDVICNNIRSKGYIFSTDEAYYTMPWYDEYADLESENKALVELLKTCKELNISTLDQVAEIIDRNVDSLEYFNYINDDESWFVSKVFIVTLIVIKEYNKELSTEYLVELGWGENIAQRVFDGIDKMENNTEQSKR